MQHEWVWKLLSYSTAAHFIVCSASRVGYPELWVAQRPDGIWVAWPAQSAGIELDPSITTMEQAQEACEALDVIRRAAEGT